MLEVHYNIRHDIFNDEIPYSIKFNRKTQNWNYSDSVFTDLKGFVTRVYTAPLLPSSIAHAFFKYILYKY